jgi:hypothetical protein
LIKEFKKKKFTKQNNKYVKIKREDNNLFIVIKKLVFLDGSEASSLSKIKQKTEKIVLSLFKKRKNISLEEHKPSNYYEYFLLKNLGNSKKIDKKILNKLFNDWLHLSKKERKTLINEFNEL